MRPRLPSCEWTDDDLVIFARLGWVSTWQQRRMIERYVDADRRDAELMLRAQTCTDWACLPDRNGFATLEVRGRTWRRYL